jgi:hypothetical protein
MHFQSISAKPRFLKVPAFRTQKYCLFEHFKKSVKLNGKRDCRALGSQ